MKTEFDFKGKVTFDVHHEEFTAHYVTDKSIAKCLACEMSEILKRYYNKEVKITIKIEEAH
jgi:hypothetical protein